MNSADQNLRAQEIEMQLRADIRRLTDALRAIAEVPDMDARQMRNTAVAALMDTASHTSAL